PSRNACSRRCIFRAAGGFPSGLVRCPRSTSHHPWCRPFRALEPMLDIPMLKRTLLAMRSTCGPRFMTVQACRSRIEWSGAEEALRWLNQDTILRLYCEKVGLHQAASPEGLLMSSNRVKVGIVGLGRWAKVLTRAVR